MRHFHFATYATENYLPLLDCCLTGCKKFLGTVPVIYAMDNAVYREASARGYETIQVNTDGLEPHVVSLQILRQCSDDCLVMIDADCWPLRQIELSAEVTAFLHSGLAGAGDVGFLDIPYLFKSVPREQLFDRIHETFATYPHFAAKWTNARVMDGCLHTSGTPVDIPLLYGGFAFYAPAAFRHIPVPEWIHSADIWLSAYAADRNLSFLSRGSYQFNRQMNDSFEFFHLAGPKTARDVKDTQRLYKAYLGELQ